MSALADHYDAAYRRLRTRSTLIADRWSDQLARKKRARQARNAGYPHPDDLPKDAPDSVRDRAAWRYGLTSDPIPRFLRTQITQESANTLALRVAERRLWPIKRQFSMPALRDAGGMKASRASLHHAAEREASKARKQAMRTGRAEDAILYAQKRLGQSPHGQTQASQYNRAACPKWWRQKLIKLHNLVIDDAWWTAISLGLEISHEYNYINPDGYGDSRYVDTMAEEWSRNFIIQGSDGSMISPPTPNDTDKRQYAYYTTMAKGIGKLANERNFTPYLITLTAPGCKHRGSTRNGKFEGNPDHDGTSPKKAHQELQKRWQCFRARLKYREIEVYWIRSVQPHRDGTPHWHIVMWVPPGHEETIQEQLARYFLKTWHPNEPGAKKHRIDFRPIEGGTNGAVAYVIRSLAYICRSHNLATKDEKMEAERIRAWRRSHAIRTLASSLTSRTIWDRSRKPDQSIAGIGDIAHAARAGDYARFATLLGVSSPGACRKDARVKPFYLESTDQYGDQTRKLSGLINQHGEILERAITWQLLPRQSTDCTVIHKDQGKPTPEPRNTEFAGRAPPMPPFP